MNKKIAIEIIGWYGVAALIGAFALVSFSFLSPSSIIYQLLNLTGALGVLTDAYTQRNYQPVVVNAFWAAIAVISLIRTFF